MVLGESCLCIIKCGRLLITGACSGMSFTCVISMPLAQWVQVLRRVAVEQALPTSYQGTLLELCP